MPPTSKPVDSTDTSTPDATTLTADQLTQSFATAVRSVIDAVKPPKVSIADFKPVTAFNPTGARRRRLKRTVYQNGARMNPALLTDKEIALLDKVKPGRYCEGLVTVHEVQRGGNTEVHLAYANKTLEDRMALKNVARNLQDMLEQCCQ